MNKRIQALAEQAGYTKDMFGVGHWDMPECKKFAELIVREMCQVINDDCQLQMRQRVLTNLGGLNQARELIKQHFGVEE